MKTNMEAGKELQKQDHNDIKTENIKILAENAHNLALADMVIYKTYLEKMDETVTVHQCPDKLTEMELNSIAHFFRVERFVSEKNENNRDKLISVFHAVASCGGSVLVLIRSDGKKINYYFGTKRLINENLDINLDILENAEQALVKTLKGNFPGTNIVDVLKEDGGDENIKKIFHNEDYKKQPKNICTITGIAGLRSKEESREKLFVQGMEKLIDSMRGAKYSLLLIADPVDQEDVNVVKQGYENLYSEFFPFADLELTYGVNESKSVSTSLTEGFSESISKSVTDSLTYTKGSSKSHTHTSSDNVNIGVSGQSGISFGIPGIGGGSLSRGISVGYGHGESDSDMINTQKSIAKGSATAKGKVNTTDEHKSETDQKTWGENISLQIKFEDKSVKNRLEKIDLQLKRLDACRDTGMWNCSVYCLANDSSVCKIVASAYQSILRGENSSIEAGTVTQWSEKNAIAILPWLEKMHHPKLQWNDRKITPSSLISTAELTIHAGIPQSSVSGLPVLEMAAFGREVTNDNKDDVYLGDIYHMGNKEETRVVLNKTSLTSHTFITGSTGSGKSYTVYQLLGEVTKEETKPKVNFLVIEPAKGHYKNFFGNRPDVSVYGTDPALTRLLRINPFAFSQNIHILAHLERLIEIFNVCWSMYASMPALLKDAIETSYEQAGWDLASSTFFKKGSPQYPGFADITRNITQILDNSTYSEEVKGNLTSALIIRLESLSNGIYGMIFTNDELGDKKLFEENVIVDLSDASPDTQALIMGILLLKLQEYCKTSRVEKDELRHITVLEEAHKLLKKTSTEQSNETANLQGKSVEMLANAIAEMRAYGEGFIIADQSPGLLDMSVIRNTNTKIILSLPGEGDRVLVGKAAGLNDDQIVELAKLPRSVAAVYQNNWIQPVLCKVPELKKPDKKYIIKPDAEIREKLRAVVDLKKYVDHNDKIDKNKLKEKIEAIDIDSFKNLKQKFIASLFKNNEKIYNDASETMKSTKTLDIPSIKRNLVRLLEPSLLDYEENHREHILNCIIWENRSKDNEMKKLLKSWNDLISRKKEV